MTRKLPSWFENPAIVYPTRLCTEQCSSAETALYKAETALEAVGPGAAIADLTGGLGVDSWAFSKIAGQILYNEMDPVLAEGVRHNFKELGISNITFRNEKLLPGNAAEVLDGFRPDLIFMDPARRASDGKKVFLLEDCSPDILGLRDELLGISRYLLVKLSPMADISMAVSRLGNVRDVHVVASEGECKELLVLIDREFAGECLIHVYESGKMLTARPSEEKEAAADYPGKTDWEYLFELGKALSKAGIFNLVCARFGLRKLAPSTHLYVTDTPHEDLSGLGKLFSIKEILPMGNKAVKEIRSRYPEAEVTARNLPVSSDGLRKKLGIRPSAAFHIFAAKAVFPEKPGNYLIVTSPLNPSRSPASPSRG